MKFRELFHETNGNLYPDWPKILSIKEFRDLTTCPQSTLWHKEGHVFTHTCAVTNQMVNYFHRMGWCMNDDYYIQMVSAAMCHDLGKPSSTTWNEELHEYKTKSHGLAGARITRYLFFDEEIELRERVCAIVKNHMILHHVFDGGQVDAIKKLKKLSWNMVRVKDMNLMKYCDSMGSQNDIETDESKMEDCLKIKELAEELGCYETTFKYESAFDRLKQNYGIAEDVEQVEGFNVFVLIGLPGSGKDTFINEIKKVFNTGKIGDIPVLCRDTIRSEIGLKGEKPQGNKAEEDKVTHIFNQRMKELCENHTNFFINNTNLLRKYRENFNKVILSHGGIPVYIYIEAPTLEETKKRREGMIDPKVIDNMFWRMDFPEPSEYSLPIIFQKQKPTV